MEGERQPRRLDARDVSGLPVDELLRADDHRVQLVEDAVLRVHLRAEYPLPGPPVRRRGDGRAVAEPEALPQVECHRPASVRDRRERPRGFRDKPRAGLTRLVLKVHEQQLGGVENGPVGRYVREGGIERVDDPARVADPQRAAAQCPRGADLLRRGGGNADSRRRDEQGNSGARQEQGDHVLRAHTTPLSQGRRRLLRRFRWERV